MNYKGFTIEEECNLWALDIGSKYRWFIDGEKIHGATSIEDAIEQIDEHIIEEEYKYLKANGQP